MGLTVARALLAVAVALVAGCGCPKIHQEVFVSDPDPELQALVDACNAHVPIQNDPCLALSATTTTPPPIACGCLPLCKRVLEIIDQFSGSEELQSCDVNNSADGGNAVAVTVTYRPSTCR